MSIERTQKVLDDLYSNCRKFDCPSDFRALAISDVHLGIGDDADDFADNDVDFLRVGNDFLQRGYHLIILGDLLDLWENRDSAGIVKAHPVIFDLIAKFEMKDRLIELEGNHDGDLPFPDAMRLLFPSGKEIFLTHGHRGDWANDRESWFGKAFVRYVWAGIGERIFGLHDPTSARSEANPQKHMEIRNAYNDWINRQGDILLGALWGHTHYVENVGRSFNCGCWIGEHREGVEIVGEQIKLMDFS
jgi:predicted phosphodiesterase